MVDTGAKWRFLVVEPGADWISAIVDDYRTKNGSEPSAIYAGSMDNPVPLGDACKWAVQRRRESAAHGPGCWFKYRSMDDGKILVLATGRYIPYGKARELARKAAEIVHANVDMPFRCYRPDGLLTDDLEEIITFGIQQGYTMVTPRVVEQIGQMKAVKLEFMEDGPEHLVLEEGLLELELKPLE